MGEKRVTFVVCTIKHAVLSSRLDGRSSEPTSVICNECAPFGERSRINYRSETNRDHPITPLIPSRFIIVSDQDGKPYKVVIFSVRETGNVSFDRFILLLWLTRIDYEERTFYYMQFVNIFFVVIGVIFSEREKLFFVLTLINLLLIITSVYVFLLKN